MKKKQVTVSQKRIAQDLGVSQALVSLVLNGKRENISEDSYQRIWNHALKIGYRPKGMTLPSNPSTATGVGFILRAGLRLHNQSNFFSHVQHGLHTALLSRGFHSLFLGSEDDLGREGVQDVLRRHRLYGVAVLGEVMPEFIQAVTGVQKNTVTISFSYPGLCHSVMPNEKQALELLVSHLAELGHREFAWIGGDKGLDYNLRRHARLDEALEARGLKISRKFAVDVDIGDRLGGWKAAEILAGKITRKNFPTACVCGNASTARGVINFLMQKGWRIPEQISVVAVDATRICTEEYPQITGAHADPERIGTTAADLLMQTGESHKEALHDVIVPSYLTIRETSAPPP